YDGGGTTYYTTSSDGITWSEAVVCTGLTNAGHATVKKIGDSYRIWYWPNLSYSINDMRTAVSADGIAWTDDQPLQQVGNSVVSSQMTWNRGSYGPADVLYNPAGSETIVEPVDAASVW